MNENVKLFLEHYTDVITDCEKFAFLPRDIQYQKKSVKKLTELLGESADVREAVILEEDEEAANQILALRCMINAVRYDLKMWIDIKQGEWDKAWNSLVDAQESAKSGRTAHDIALHCNVENYLSKLEYIEKFLFPPQNFNSPEIIVSRFICSLCNEDYNECNHIAGQSYWGFFCQRVVDDIATMRASAIVENPKDKKARITEHITEDNMIRNQMTWTKKEMTEEEKEKYEDKSNDQFVMRGILLTADDNPTDFSEYFPE